MLQIWHLDFMHLFLPVKVGIVEILVLTSICLRLGGCLFAMSVCYIYMLSRCILLIVGFQDVAFLASRASFSTTFLRNCDRGKSLVTTTCL